MVKLKDGEIELRLLKDEDLEDLVKYANNKKIADNLGPDMPHPYTIEDGKWWIDNNKNNEYQLAITINNSFAGMIGMTNIDDKKSDHCKNFGYWVGEPYWGKGIMTRAVQLFTNYAFDKFKDIHRLQAYVYDYNPASARVLEKAGFTKEGTRKDGVFLRGKIFSEDTYRLLRNELK